MALFNSPNPRLSAPLPRRDILAVCAFLNRAPVARDTGARGDGPEGHLDRLAAAARMQ